MTVVDRAEVDAACADDPEGSSRHDYRLTVSSYYGIGADQPGFRAGENPYRCRGCGDVFVVLDTEMEALDEERRADGD